jgi:hypothetical protein
MIEDGIMEQLAVTRMLDECSVDLCCVYVQYAMRVSPLIFPSQSGVIGSELTQQFGHAQTRNMWKD